MHTFKITASIALLLTIIIVSGIFSLKMLESSSKNIEQHLSLIESSTTSGDWAKSKSQLDLVNASWKKTSKVWTALIDHFEIDNIDTSLSKMEKYIYAKDTSMALAEIAALKQFIKHIPETEAFNLKNIL
jgi:hypothetical protein